MQEGGFVLKDWIEVFLIMEGLLVSLSTCSAVSANMMLLKLFFLSSPSLSCSKPVLLSRKEEIHNKTPYSSLLNALLLRCINLSSKLHILEAGETPWNQRCLLMAFPFFLSTDVLMITLLVVLVVEFL